VRAAQRDPPLYALAREEDCECDQRCQDDGDRYERSSMFGSQLKIEN
jgi:hypothetical protein